MVGGFLAYGIPVTGEFGNPRDLRLSGRLKIWMATLYDLDGDDLDANDPEQAELKAFSGKLTGHPTAEADWLVAGLDVDTGRLTDPDYYASLQPAWEALMADVPDDVRQNLKALGGPGFHVIYGKY